MSNKQLITDVQELFRSVCESALENIETSTKSYELVFETSSVKPYVVLVDLIRTHPRVLSADQMPLKVLIDEIVSLQHIQPQQHKAARLIQQPLQAAWKKYTDILSKPNVFDRYFLNMERGNPGSYDRLINSTITLANVFDHKLVKDVFNRNVRFDDDFVIFRDAMLLTQNRLLVHKATPDERKRQKRKIDEIDVYSPAWKDAAEHSQRLASKPFIEELLTLVSGFTDSVDREAPVVPGATPETKNEVRQAVKRMQEQLAAFQDNLHKQDSSARDCTVSTTKTRTSIRRWLSDWMEFLQEQPDRKQIKQRRDEQTTQLRQMWLTTKAPLAAMTRDEWTAELGTKNKAPLVDSATKAALFRQRGAITEEMKMLRSQLIDTLKMPETDRLIISINKALTVSTGTGSDDDDDDFDSRSRELDDKASDVDFVCYALSFLERKDEFEDGDSLLAFVKQKKEHSIPQAPQGCSLFKACNFVSSLLSSVSTDAATCMHGTCKGAYECVLDVKQQLDSLLNEFETEDRVSTQTNNAQFLNTLRGKTDKAVACAASTAKVVTVKPQPALEKLMAKWNAAMYAQASNTSFVAVEARACHAKCLDAMTRCTSETVVFSDYATAIVYMLSSCIVLSRV